MSLRIGTTTFDVKHAYRLLTFRFYILLVYYFVYCYVLQYFVSNNKLWLRCNSRLKKK